MNASPVWANEERPFLIGWQQSVAPTATVERSSWFPSARHRQLATSLRVGAGEITITHFPNAEHISLCFVLPSRFSHSVRSCACSSSSIKLLRSLADFTIVSYAATLKTGWRSLSLMQSKQSSCLTEKSAALNAQ